MWNRTEVKIELVLIRHGATQSNQEHRYLGQTDEELSAEGRMELERLLTEESYPKVDGIYASPMKRCRETAALLYPGVEQRLVDDWKEMNFGEFEGKNYLELQDNAKYQAWIDSNGTLPFPQGESREEFIARCKAGVHQMLSQLEREENPWNTIGIVAHGGTIMAILSAFCGGEYFDYQVKNGRGYIAILEKSGEHIQMNISRKL